MTTYRRQIAISILMLASLAPLGFGILGIGRGLSGGQVDFDHLHAAGRCWLQGESPYLPGNLQKHNISQHEMAPLFGYPPQFSLITVALGIQPLPIARSVFTSTNVILLFFLAWLTMNFAERTNRAGGGDRLEAWPVAVFVIVCPFAAHVLWMGQTSLIVGTALAAGWHFGRQGNRPALGGALLALATVKPQWVLLPMLWLLLERRWWLLATAAVAGLVLATPAIALDGPIGALRAWLDGVTYYQDSIYNQPGFRHVTGLPSLLAAAGVQNPPDLTLLAIGLTFGLWLSRRYIPDEDILPILLLLSASFLFGHDYDFIILAPAFAAGWRHAQGNRLHILLLFVLVSLLFFPQRFIRVIDIPVLWHWRTAVLLVALIWLILAAIRNQSLSTKESESISNIIAL